MLERMNGRFNEHVLDKYLLDTCEQLEVKLMEHIHHYNYYIKQKALDYRSPMEYIEHMQLVPSSRPTAVLPKAKHKPAEPNGSKTHKINAGAMKTIYAWYTLAKRKTTPYSAILTPYWAFLRA